MIGQKKILFIGTGGTISCSRTENGLAPALSADELVSYINLNADIQAEQLFELDSTNMTPRHWERLARRIRDCYNEFDGFVITHGTDTMAYAAAALSCLIQNPRKPIVLTGSMRSMTEENSDAPINLRSAAAFAADSRAFGVRVVFSGMIIDGRCACKRKTNGFDAFESVNRAISGTVSDSGICFDEEYGGETRFYERLSDGVCYIKLIPGQKLYFPEDVKVLILESYGSGGVPDYLGETVRALADRGVYIIISTQCAYGGTDLSRYEVGSAAVGGRTLIEAGRYTAEYTTAMAQWALEYSNDFNGFRDLFCMSEYYSKRH